MKIRTQHDKRFFPIGGCAPTHSTTSGFSFSIRCSYLGNLNIINFLHSLFDFDFIGFGMHLKGIGSQSLRQMGSLFGY